MIFYCILLVRVVLEFIKFKGRGFGFLVFNGRGVVEFVLFFIFFSVFRSFFLVLGVILCVVVNLS